MAVTGTGTSTDPYVVHNYTELKEACAYRVSGRFYIKLNNDIDCNSYGDTFEWETITLGNGNDAGGYVTLDLNGKTIKNMKIANGNCLFSPHYNNYENCVIKNGKILNVFSNNASNIFYNMNNRVVDMTNVAMSVNATSTTGTLFHNVTFNKCSLYLITNKLLGVVFNHNSNYQLQFTDIYININNCNGKQIFNGSKKHAKSCRIQGDISGNVYSSGQLRYTIGVGQLEDTVVYLDASNVTNLNSFNFYNYIVDESASTGVAYIVPPFENAYGNYSGLTKVTDAEIRSSDSLISKGFNVIKVIP